MNFNISFNMGPLMTSQTSQDKILFSLFSTFFSPDRGFSLGAGDRHGNRMQGGDLQQGLMIDVGGMKKEPKGQTGVCWK